MSALRAAPHNEDDSSQRRTRGHGLRLVDFPVLRDVLRERVVGVWRAQQRLNAVPHPSGRVSEKNQMSPEKYKMTGGWRAVR